MFDGGGAGFTGLNLPYVGVLGRNNPLSTSKGLIGVAIDLTMRHDTKTTWNERFQ